MKKQLIAIAIGSALLSPSAYAENSITEALEASKPVLDLRLRYESNDTEGGPERGEALTLKSVIGIKTGEFKGFSAYADMTNVSALDSDYRSSGASTIETDIIPDPEGDELNQAYLQYADDHQQIRFGRQRIIYDNARFIGNVGWRQNEQTFDAFSYKNTALDNVTVNLAYLVQTYGIFFNSADTNSLLANVAIDSVGPGKLSLYAYDLEDANDNENTTFGFIYAGKANVEASKLLYRLELASQSLKPSAGSDADTDYLSLEIGAVITGVTAKLGYELLGSDSGNAGFATPLATGHKFNGWADKFLAPRDNGLEDTYFSVSGKVSGVKLAAIYHVFSEDEGGADLGSEINLLAVKKFTKNYSAGLKLASFSADSSSTLTDTDKVWLWGQAKF